MHPVEQEHCLKSLEILVDTREQPSARAEKRYKGFGVPYHRQKLDFGDYTFNFTLPNGKKYFDSNGSIYPIVAVERKMDLDELASCFCRDRKRFTKEFERASEQGAKVYLLVEDANWENLINGKYKSKFNAAAYIGSVTALDGTI